jgi:hypothetical protein
VFSKEDNMATQQGWDDFKSLSEQWRGVLNMITTLKVEADLLAALKVSLIDDEDRYSGMVPIGNQYPDYNMNSIAKDVERVIAVKALLVANGF